MAGNEAMNPAQSGGQEEKGGPMRSHVEEGKFMPPEPEYDPGDDVFIDYIDPGKSRDLVTVCSKGRWNKFKETNEYKLKFRKDGTPFKNGEWIKEECLNSTLD